jgi:hypothetical protein
MFRNRGFIFRKTVVYTGTVRYGTVRYGTVRYGTVRYGTVRFTWICNRLPEDEPSGSKHVEDIKIKN